MRRRRVYYDAVSRVATLAGALLSDGFDVRPLAPGHAPEAPAVLVLDGESGDRPRPPDVHVIALVDPRSTGPWPTDWFMMLPHGASGASAASCRS
jgi:hypothetical protein